MLNKPTWKIFGAQLNLLGFVVGLLLFFALIGLGVGITRHAAQDDAVTRSEKATHFWYVVAGLDAGTAPTVDNHFARDIRAIAHDERAINTFRGSSNTYGGVTEAIGFDPFDETGLSCFECGPLSAQLKDNLAAIRSTGNLAPVLAQYQVTTDDGFTLTLWGTAVSANLLVLWLIISPVALAMAYGTTRDKYGIRNFGDVAWPLPMKIITPTVFVPYLLYRRSTVRKFERKVRHAFPEHLVVIDQVDQELEHMPPTARGRLQQARDDVMGELESHTRSGSNDSNDLVSKYLFDSLAQVKENLVLRQAALVELNGGEHPLYQEEEKTNEADQDLRPEPRFGHTARGIPPRPRRPGRRRGARPL